jgi:hypothetical protein
MKIKANTAWHDARELYLSLCGNGTEILVYMTEDKRLLNEDGSHPWLSCAKIEKKDVPLDHWLELVELAEEG